MRGAVLSVYRERNAHVLERLLEPAVAEGWPVALWALDQPAPTLELWTHGHGPGTKFDLVNGLLPELKLEPDDWVAVVDDDAVFVRGTLLSFVSTAAAAGLGLAQPAHALRSNISHRITWRRPFSTARLTTFVEIGPIFAVEPAWRGRVLPFPGGIGMGWGLELDWMELRKDGCRLGIVDATPVRHLARFAAGYSPHEEVAELERRLGERGAPGWGDLRRTLATWRPWQRRPPWLAS
jgi:hypothetical protein